MVAPLAYRSPWREQEHDDLADTARTFFAKEVVPHQEAFATQGHPDPALYRRAGELGLLGLAVPEEYGGGGGTFAHEAVLYEQQTYAVDSSLGLGVHTGIVMGYLTDYGTPEQKARWLPQLCSGERVGAIAMTEPGGGSDLQAIRTHAVRDGDDYLVSGSKTFITNGFLAGLLVLAVKTDPVSARRASRCWSARSATTCRASGAAGCCTRSACTATTPRSCSSTRCACPRRTCSARPRVRVSCR